LGGIDRKHFDEEASSSGIPISNPISLATMVNNNVSETVIPIFPDPPDFVGFSNEEEDLPANIGSFLLESCLTESWTSVDNQLRVLDKAFRFDGKREAIVQAVNLADEVNFIEKLEWNPCGHLYIEDVAQLSKSQTKRGTTLDTKT
jgi:hypothetical protein